MNKMVLFLFVLLMGVGCMREDVPTEDYFVKTEEYLQEIDNFKKEIPKLVQIVEKDWTRFKLLEDKINNMKDEIQQFRSLIPPDSLKSEHNMTLTYNDSFEFLLNQTLDEMKKDESVSEQSKDFLIGNYITNVSSNLSDLIKHSLLEETS